MAVAQEQQQAVSEALKNLEDRQVALNAVIARAGTAVEEMNKAGHASARIIEQATRISVEKAVQAALASVQQQTQSHSGRFCKSSCEGATGRYSACREGGRKPAPSSKLDQLEVGRHLCCDQLHAAGLPRGVVHASGTQPQ